MQTVMFAACPGFANCCHYATTLQFLMQPGTFFLSYMLVYLPLRTEKQHYSVRAPGHNRRRNEIQMWCLGRPVDWRSQTTDAIQINLSLININPPQASFNKSTLLSAPNGTEARTIQNVNCLLNERDDLRLQK